MQVGTARSGPLGFGWRVPMWDPDGRPAAAWFPGVRANLDALRGHFDSLWLSDHFVPGTRWMPPDPDAFECWTATTFLAAAYPEFRLGQIVMANSFRHPPLLAKMAATLQFLSGGRLILGLGAGWMESEYRAFGYPFPSAAVRLRQLEEGVDIIRRLWTGAPTTYQGRYYQVEEAVCHPAPSPPPPIMLGLSGERIGLRIVARLADWWNLASVGEAELRRKIGVLEGACAEVGRDPRAILYTWECPCVVLADSEAEATAVARRSKFFQHYAPEHQALLGTPEHVAEVLAGYVDAGVRHIILRFLDAPRPESALRFAAEVAPRLRTALPA